MHGCVFIRLDPPNMFIKDGVAKCLVVCRFLCERFRKVECGVGLFKKGWVIYDVGMLRKGWLCCGFAKVWFGVLLVCL